MSKHIKRSVATAALSALVVAGGVSAAVPSHAAPAPAANAFGAFTPMAAQAGAVSITDITEGPGTATITWSAPLEDGGSPITDYEVEVGHYPDGNYEVVHDAQVTVTGTTAEVTGLERMADYWVRVWAVNEEGRGAMASRPFTTTAGVPGRPTLTAKVHNSWDSATLTIFAHPDFRKSGAIDTYTVEVYNHTTNELVDSATISASAFSDTYSVEGLERVTEYRAVVTATNAEGTSPAATERFTTKAQHPGAVGDLSHELTGTEATISWTAPEDDGGKPVLGYHLQVWKDGTPAGLVELTETSYTLSGLQRGMEYGYAVKAENADWEPWLPEPMATFAVPYLAPPAVDIDVVATTETSLRAEWDAPEGEDIAPVTGYAVAAYDPADSEVFSAVVEDTWVEIDGLAPATTYTITVTALTEDGEGDPASAAATTADLAPDEDKSDFDLADLAIEATATPLSDTSVRIEWTRPDVEDPSVVHGYEMRLYQDGEPVITTTSGLTWARTQQFVPDVTASFHELWAEVTGLDPETTYTAEVVALTKDSEGPASIVEATTLAAPVDDETPDNDNSDRIPTGASSDGPRSPDAASGDTNTPNTRDDSGGKKATSSGRVDALSDSGAPVATLAGLASVLLLAGAGGLALVRRRQQQG